MIDNSQSHLDSSERLLKDKEVGRLLGVSRAKVWGDVKKGIIPKPIKLGGITRFPLSDILGVIENAKNARAA